MLTKPRTGTDQYLRQRWLTEALFGTWNAQDHQGQGHEHFEAPVCRGHEVVTCVAFTDLARECEDTSNSGLGDHASELESSTGGDGLGVASAHELSAHRKLIEHPKYVEGLSNILKRGEGRADKVTDCSFLEKADRKAVDRLASASLDKWNRFRT